MLCDYGCGKESIFQLKNGRYCCSKRPAGCDVIKKINSEGGKRSYSSGKRKPVESRNFSEESRKKQAWAKGLTAETDPRVKASADSQRGKSKVFANPMKQEGRDNISKGRVKIILEGRHDTSGRKGHRGHYDGVYFHSSWELAFYVFIKETTNLKIERNTTYVINYLFENLNRRYVPDFIVEEKLIEIKSYLHGDRDLSKYNQTKDKVEYKFEKDLQNELNYCKQKYGNEFWKKLYSNDNPQQ